MAGTMTKILTCKKCGTDVAVTIDLALFKPRTYSTMNHQAHMSTEWARHTFECSGPGPVPVNGM